MTVNIISPDLSLHGCKTPRYVASSFYAISIRINVLNRTCTNDE